MKWTAGIAILFYWCFVTYLIKTVDPIVSIKHASLLPDSYMFSGPLCTEQSPSLSAVFAIKRPMVCNGSSQNCTYLILSLLLSGDIHSNPGPASKPKSSKLPKYTCVYCEKGVRSNSRAVSCDNCDQWVHIACANISKEGYDEIVKSGDDFDFMCNRCLCNVLPNLSVNSSMNIDDSIVSEEEPDLSMDGRNSNFNIPSEASVDHFQCFRRKGLHFIHLNTRSLLHKIEELRILASKTSAAVIGCTETWLDNTVQYAEISIPNYVMVRKDRNRMGGGVCMYIRSDLAFNPRTDLEHEDLEAIWIELLLPKTKPIIIGTCYRPPKQSDFYKLLKNSISNCNRISDLEIYILGDMNTDVSSKNKRSCIYNNMLSLCRMFDLNQIIVEPTHVTDCSESVIDLIFVSDTDKICQSGVISVGVSDHMLTFCTRKVSRGQINSHKTVKIRSMKNYTVDDFNDKLSNVDWSEVTKCKDSDLAFTRFSDIFLEIIDEVAPVKEVRLKQRSEPWVTGEILDCIQERDLNLYKYKKTNKCPILSSSKKFEIEHNV